VLEIVAVIVSIVMLDPAYFLLIAAFDIGYVVSAEILSKKILQQ